MWNNAVIFCRYCQILSSIFRDCGLQCQSLHSVMPQKHRLAALNSFKSQESRILVATDVASRGLDIPAVDLVVNHNVPTKTKNYVHRVGRTARAGRGGKAMTLVTQFDVNLVKAIEELISEYSCAAQRGPSQVVLVTLLGFKKKYIYFFLDIKLVEEKVDDKEVTQLAMKVAMAKRMAEIVRNEQHCVEKFRIFVYKLGFDIL